jgi:hypothetical protein
MLLVPAAKDTCIIAESVQLIGTCWVEIQIQKMNWPWGFCFPMMMVHAWADNHVCEWLADKGM